jgi:hypothetical protein
MISMVAVASIYILRKIVDNKDILKQEHVQDVTPLDSTVTEGLAVEAIPSQPDTNMPLQNETRTDLLFEQ